MEAMKSVPAGEAIAALTGQLKQAQSEIATLKKELVVIKGGLPDNPGEAPSAHMRYGPKLLNTSQLRAPKGPVHRGPDGHFVVPYSIHKSDAFLDEARRLRAAVYAKRHSCTMAEAIGHIWGDTDREDIQRLKFIASPEFQAEARSLGQQRALQASSVSGGGALREMTRLNGEFAELLYNASVVMAAGARSVDMPQGQVSFGRMNTGATAYWVAEGANGTASEPTFGEIIMVAKKLFILVAISNDQIRFGNDDLDRYVRDDMVGAGAEEIDEQLLLGSGAESKPLGVYNHVGVTLNNLDTNGKQPERRDVVRTKRLLAQSVKNNKLQSPAWIFNAESWEGLYQIVSANGEPIFAREMEMGRLLGDPYFLTEQIPSTYTVGSSTDCTLWFHGYFGELLIGSTGVSEIESIENATYIDSGSNTRVGTNRDESVLRYIRYTDAGIKRPAAFIVRRGVRNLADG